MSYAKKLIEAGISENRAYGLASAISSLVTEICKLDLKNRREFLRISVDHRLSEFARTENTMDAIEANLQEQVDRAYSMLDIDGGVADALTWFDETRESITDLVEIRLPGAAQALVQLDKLWMLYYESHKAEVIRLNENPVDSAVAQITAELEDPKLLWDGRSRAELMTALKTEILTTLGQYDEGLLADWESLDYLIDQLKRVRSLLPEPKLSWLKK